MKHIASLINTGTRNRWYYMRYNDLFRFEQNYVLRYNTVPRVQNNRYSTVLYCGVLYSSTLACLIMLIWEVEVYNFLCPKQGRACHTGPSLFGTHLAGGPVLHCTLVYSTVQ